MLENVIGCLEVEIGAERNLVLWICSCDCESVEILTAQSDCIADGQLDTPANESVGATDRADVDAETTCCVKKDFVGRCQTGAAESFLCYLFEGRLVDEALGISLLLLAAAFWLFWRNSSDDRFIRASDDQRLHG